VKKPLPESVWCPFSILHISIKINSLILISLTSMKSTKSGSLQLRIELSGLLEGTRTFPFEFGTIMG
jgi:hypothetical protein